MNAKILLPVAVLCVVVFASLYQVDQVENAILFKLGEIQKVEARPGLHFKLPLINNVRRFDMRLQTLETQPQRFLTSEKKDLIVDSSVRWRIEDVVQFYISTGGDERRAGLLLYQKINDGLRNEFGKRTVREVVSGERGAIRDIVTELADQRGAELGMRIVDVRLKRIDLPDEVSSTVYERMRSERARVARELRSAGDREAIRIQAEADKQRTVVLAAANRDAEILRGEGDALATEIYASAYAKDPGFFEFYRSLNAYKSSFAGRQDVLLLEPDSEFFRFFNDSGAGR